MSSHRCTFTRRGGVVLIILLAMTVSTGCGGSSPTAGPKNAVVQPTSSAPGSKKAGVSADAQQTASAAQPTHAAATPKGASALTSIQRLPASPSGRLLRRFTGYGNSALGTIVVRSASVLIWNARHPAIQIFTSSGFMLVNSKATTGTVRLSRGTYRGVRVASDAGWSIELRSRSA